MMDANSKDWVKFRRNSKIAVVSKDHGEYLFSLTVHIIKVNKDKFGARGPHRVDPEWSHDFLVLFNTACYMYVSALKSTVIIQEIKEDMPQTQSKVILKMKLNYI